MPGLSATTLYALSAYPNVDSRGRAGETFDLDLPPSATRWMIIEYLPHRAFRLHHTNSVDFDIVLAGTVELVLDDGVHLMRAGDCVVVTGVDHAWRAGPDGCRLSVMSIGAHAE
jgi:quercetin dioxygenase-like cupin family protein